MTRQLVPWTRRVLSAVLVTVMALGETGLGSADAAPSLPSVGTSIGVLRLTAHSLLLQIFVNPHGSRTRVWIQYGPTAQLGQSTATLNIVAAQIAQSVQRTISPLQSNTTYYVRGVAQNAKGVVHGPTYSITTPRANPTSAPGSTPGLVSLHAMTVRAPRPDSALASVSCPSAHACWAVGYSGSTNSLAVIEQLRGDAWQPVSVTAAADTVLSGVACPAIVSCWAVGGTSAQLLPYILHFDGRHWTPVPAPHVAGSTGDELNAVTCTSVSNCWAVGLSNGGTPRAAPLAEHWDGQGWRIASTPNPGDSSLLSVSCSTATSCWAGGMAGSFTSISNQRPLILQFNGARWMSVTAPTGANFVTSVDCHLAVDCFALADRNGSASAPSSVKVLRRLGATWRIVATANPLFSPNALYCATVHSCWMVGNGGGGTYENGPAIVSAHWDGSRWSNDTISFGPGISTSLNAISCATATTCYAVGYSNPPITTPGSAIKMSPLVAVMPTAR